MGIFGYRSSDDSWRRLRIDGATDSLQVLDYPHHEIHAGSHFIYTDSVELDSAETQDYLITTPNDVKWAHMIMDRDGSAITQFLLYEGSDKIGTTPQNTINNNRNSANVSTTKIHKGTSGGTTDGTLISQYKSGAASAQSKQGSEVRNENEIILKQNTKYILRIISSTNANLVNVRLVWYEHVSIG